MSTARTATAEYLASQASRLARLASANDLPLLAYLFDMAVLEAWHQASGEAEADVSGEAGDGPSTAGAKLSPGD